MIAHVHVVVNPTTMLFVQIIFPTSITYKVSFKYYSKINILDSGHSKKKKLYAFSN